MTTTLFTWGYYGWGNHTPSPVEAVDAVETSRGFQPPVFVDIRIRRSVRAAGFTGPEQRCIQATGHCTGSSARQSPKRAGGSCRSCAGSSTRPPG